MRVPWRLTSQELSYSCLLSKVTEKGPCLRLATHFHDIYIDTIFFESSVPLPGQTVLSQSFTLNVEGTLLAQPLGMLKLHKANKSLPTINFPFWRTHKEKRSMGVL